MADLKPQVLWYASLSNGETHYEGRGNYIVIPGESTPWRRFYDYSVKNGLQITSVGLITPDKRHLNLPSIGNSPRFARFQEVQKPIDYHIERVVANERRGARDENGNETYGEPQVKDFFTVARAIYPGYELEIWVDEFNFKNSWSLVKGNNA